MGIFRYSIYENCTIMVLAVKFIKRFWNTRPCVLRHLTISEYIISQAKIIKEYFLCSR